MSRGSISRGCVAAQSGTGPSEQAPGNTGKAGPQPGDMQPVPHCFLPVSSATGILSLSLPVSAVHDGLRTFFLHAHF